MDVATIEDKISEINTEIGTINSDMRSAIDGVLGLISGFPLPLPPGTYDRAREAGDDAWNKWQSDVTDPAEEAAKLIIRCINDYKSLSQTAPQYCQVEFDHAKDLLGGQTLGPQPDDWTSANTELYRQAVDGLPNKLENIRAGVEEICTILESLKQSYTDVSIDIVLQLGGLVLGLVGLAATVAGIVTAVVTAAPTVGVGFVVGLVLSVVGLVATVGGIGLTVAGVMLTLDRFERSRETAVEDLRTATSNVQSQTWPRKPGMGADGWSD